MKKISIALLYIALSINAFVASAQKIDRKALVTRHNVKVSVMDTLSSLTVGNGKFAFTVDATGLQSFPEYYAHGVPLGTQSEWGWHTNPNTEKLTYSETLKALDFENQPKGALYAVQNKIGRGAKATDYFRVNPHRLQLGNIGLQFIKKDGSVAQPQDIKNINQKLNLWTGEITSTYSVEGSPVKVITCGDASRDAIAFKITSPLLKEKRIKVKFKFPYPTMQFADMGTNYTHAEAHQTILSHSASSNYVFKRILDKDEYYLTTNFTGKSEIKKVADHDYDLLPGTDDTFAMTVAFSKPAPTYYIPQFDMIKKSSLDSWAKYWLSGAAVDLSGSTDPRAKELERRIILSQYLLRVQEAGNYPPQETGLTYNSWYGRPHMEMLWWHTAQFALWGRPQLMEKSMQWYFIAYRGAEAIAKRQGYAGVRWQKMTDNEAGESPSNVGSFLLWQQPNIIYQAELLYRAKPSKQLLQKYQKLINGTVDFMASFAHYNPATKHYDLGKGIIPAQESFNSSETFNSPYELAYWKWALQVAQKWRVRLGLTPNKKWQDVIDKIAPLAQKDGLYNAAESVDDSYSPESKFTVDHPAVLQGLSTLPANGVIDTAIMHKTYTTVNKVWHWDHTWGWDFPMVAMTATRLNQPEDAIDMLFKNVHTNTFLPNGHNYQDKRLTIYLPGNGSFLAAIALMCAGADGNKITNPGFPKNGKWKVKWEGLQRLP